MCKCINPCCCIPSGMASFIVAFIDIVLGCGTLFFCSQSVYEFKDLRNHLEKNNISDDVAWFGIVSIPLVAIVGVYSGLKLIYSLVNKSEEPNHVMKFVVFFLAEVVGFAAPFFIMDNYVNKIMKITSYSNDFIVFHLLNINPITIGIFIYQVISFWVVYRHQMIKEDKKKVVRTKARNVSPGARKNHSIVERNPNTILSGSGSGSNSRSPQKSGNVSIVPKSMYPNLDELRLEILPSPTYAIPVDSVHIVDIHDSDSADSDSSIEESTALQRVKTIASQKSQFESLKRNCLKKGILFVDEEFPANNRYLGTGRRMDWKRPHEIVKNARFFTDGFSRFDVRQGSLGDCWFLASVANLTLNEDLFCKVVPLENEWEDGGCYAGICHFRFWVNGKWEEVIIDDRLPTRNGELVYLHSSDRNEFWSALLEKAYAKLNGSYMNLSGNDGMGRAMVNLTGGTVSRYRLSEYQTNLEKVYSLLDHALKNGKMLGCCTSNKTSRNGIFDGHAYSITHVRKIMLKDRNAVPALRIRNPWGNEKEWTGEFSDGHRIWDLVDRKIRKELELIFKSDGEFWFPISELVDYFQYIEICHLP